MFGDGLVLGLLLIAPAQSVATAGTLVLQETPTTLPATRPSPSPSSKPSSTKPSSGTRPTTKPATRPSVSRPDYRPDYRPTYRPESRPDYRYRPSYQASYRYGRGFAGRVRCNSRDGRYNSCYARTQGRVMLVREHSGRCVRGSSWGYDSRRVWVSRGCRATFAYGYGSYYADRWDDHRNDGRNAALIIGGVAVAGGLIAILSRNGTTVNSATAQPGIPAKVVADPNWVPENARAALDQCLRRAARDVGATGGSRIVLQGASATAIEGDAFQISADLKADYPGATRDLPMVCEASSAQVDEFEFKA